METRTCATTGLALPVLGVGVWSFGGGPGDYWGPQDDRDAAAVVERALALGANYFDTAELYNDGRSESALGRLLAGNRERAIIGSKIFPDHAVTPDLIRSHCEATLRRLGTDYLDLYLVHWPLPAGAAPAAFDTLMHLQAEGKLRHIGVGNFGVQQLREALATGVALAVNQVPYSLLARAIEIEVLPFCAQAGIGVITYMPLMQGLLSGKYPSADDIPAQLVRTRHFRGDRPGARHGEPGAEAETFHVIDGLRSIAAREGIPMAHLALAWVAGRPGITCVLAGSRNVAQLEENAAGVALPLSATVREELDMLSIPLLTKLGPNVDLWNSLEQSRTR